MRKPFSGAVVVAVIMGVGAMPGWAEPVDQETAEMAAQAWAVRGDTLGAKMGERIESSTVHTTDTGAKFYTVKTAGGGTIVMTSDDALEPVLAFTDGEMDWTTLDRNSPMWAFLNRHVSGMTIALTNGPAPKLTTSGANSDSPKGRWAKLIREGESIRRNGLPKASDTWRRDSDITDLRVPALCKTKWQQMGNGYNYYTPNNYACGCVATAQAQIMRKHCWPTGEVERVTKSCSVDGVSTSLTTQGGVFDWANMPFSGGHTDIQRQAVGKLCSDVGITLNMSYSSGGSGSTTPKVMYSLINNFQYGGAVSLQYAYNAFGENGEEWPASRRECLERIFFANFDAGLPVSVGIPGHEVLADGYGFIDDLEYVHFNFGWAGISTCWYYVPDLTGAGSSYSYVDDLVYNIFPTNYLYCGVVSGRVLDHGGKPLSGVEVKMWDGDEGDGASAPMSATTTDERGIWSFIVKAGEWKENRKSGDPYVVRSTRNLNFSVDERWNFNAAKIENVTLDCPTDYRLYYYSSKQPEMLGNSWGNDIRLTLKNSDYPEVPNYGATFENHKPGDRWVVDEDDFGYNAGESYDGKFWWGRDVAARVDAYPGVGPIGPGAVPDAFSNLTANAQYVNFTGVVYRAISNTFDVTNVPAASPAGFPPEKIGAEGFVCDTLVRIEEARFPAAGADGGSILLPDEMMKIGVFAKGGKLVVIAGDGSGKGVTTHVYETDVAVDASVMHRLSIRAVNQLFYVWLDRQLVRCTPAQPAFPSRIGSDAAEADEIRALGFAGVGMEVDDVSHTRGKSSFMERILSTFFFIK